MIILVNVVLNRTVVDSDIHFKNPINKLKLITEFIFSLFTISKFHSLIKFLSHKSKYTRLLDLAWPNRFLYFGVLAELLQMQSALREVPLVTKIYACKKFLF